MEIWERGREFVSSNVQSGCAESWAAVDTQALDIGGKGEDKEELGVVETEIGEENGLLRAATVCVGERPARFVLLLRLALFPRRRVVYMFWGFSLHLHIWKMADDKNASEDRILWGTGESTNDKQCI